MKLSKVAISTGLVASLMFISSGIAHADTPTPSTHDIALEVINGNYGDGGERITKLTNKGFDAKVIQAEVNDILLGKVKQTPVSTKIIERQPTKVTSVQSVSDGLNMSQNSGQVDIQALANYMMANTANTAGYSASEWAYIISRESNGLVDSVNASSGAYGVFQLLGHGEYSGMPLSEQIAMASKLPAGSWVVYN
ncbi:transglycosylase [Lactococcus protaetiae]|uniref:Transglycosylase n=1 Tax=Lactococcus protaetiae TaxID=2592653 RepID=A0A514ZAP3_9LACT|nr:transglycosylase [Lactococcus protaetiae]MCL2112955.1 transglycosylase [Streptococcaceae bacterium]QDK71653.1 transglycosylase [Lactococcus protaetiae]